MRITTLHRLFSLTLMLVGLSAIGCGSGGEQAAGPDQTAAGRGVLLDPDHQAWSEAAPEVFRVRFETSKGEFVVEAHRPWAPHGADRFYNLVRFGFYDDQRVFRVRAGFIAQFGLPGDPQVTAVWKDRTMPDDPVRQSNLRGFVAYAMTGPDTRTTQIYINLADNAQLDEQGFAPIGRVVEGMDVVEKLYSGYGEDAGGGMRGGKQGKILAGGNAYLDRKFPKLDRIFRASIELAELHSLVAVILDVGVASLDERTALSLLALPLSRLDHPYSVPRNTGYLDNLTAPIHVDAHWIGTFAISYPLTAGTS
ncbi:MAG: peptidylprolyl isomerase [Acidobacteriota bacterium]